MNALRITCGSCCRGWCVGGNGSVYFRLDLLSHPCPYCEAYALSCTDVSVRRQARRRPPLRPPAMPPGRTDRLPEPAKTSEIHGER
jgi:hypothetical protein